jgi:hypothetical protein
MTDLTAARAEVIDGLRQLADFLAANPGVPVSKYGWHLHEFPARGTDPDGRADVDRAAAALGVTPRDDTASGHYSAARTFGRITYSYTHISARRRAAHDAWSSYSGSVTPGDAPEAAA